MLIEFKKYEKGSYGRLKEQQKIKAKKAGFDNVDDWLKWKAYGAIKNIDIVKKIAEENKVEITDVLIFYRFWEKVDIKDNKEECWNWTAGTILGEYGQFRVYEENTYTHRIAYMLTKGKIPDELHILHICNNRKCCNPYHLEVGDNYQNMQYRNECNRQAKGEHQGHSKLTDDQAREIHKSYNEQRKLHPGLKQWQIAEPIAKKYGITKGQVEVILNGKQWYHIWREFHQK